VNETSQIARVNGLAAPTFVSLQSIISVESPFLSVTASARARPLQEIQFLPFGCGSAGFSLMGAGIEFFILIPRSPFTHGLSSEITDKHVCRGKRLQSFEIHAPK
jgi:hypothetical protein